jgi:hypothetical protein
MSEKTPEEIEAEKVAAQAERDAEKAELAALRQEKTDRAKAEQDAKDVELEELRKLKADKDKQPKVTPPVLKTEKITPPKVEETVKPKKARVSARWFGNAAYDE